MNNPQMSAKQQYNQICEEMKQLTEVLEQNPNMSEKEFKEILGKYGELGKKLEEYGKKMWYKD